MRMAEPPIREYGCVLLPSPRVVGGTKVFAQRIPALPIPSCFFLLLVHGSFIWFFKNGAWQPNAVGGDQQGPLATWRVQPLASVWK